jgi:hypothetical protein
MPTSSRFIAKISCSCASLALRSLVLKLINPVIEVGQDRKEAVHQGIDNPIEQ